MDLLFKNSGTVAYTPGTMNRAPVGRIACFALIVFGLLLTCPVMGEETKNTSSNQRHPEQVNPSGNDNGSRDYAALGVLLSASDDAVRVVEVIPDSPAERAGLKGGDEIRSVDDDRVRTPGEVTKVIGAIGSGTPVDLIIRRDGRRQ